MPIERSVVRARIENAAEYIGPLWPLQTFNAANPLVGFEDQPFDQAVQQAGQLFGGRGYPTPSVFRQAWENGEIDPEILTRRLAEHGITQRPEKLLDRMDSDERDPSTTPTDEPLDRVMGKWLAAFLDQGQSAWPMPNRSDGFYAAWRAVAPYDGDIPAVDRAADLPDTLLEAFDDVLSGYPEKRWESIFVYHLSALPGWTGFIKWRARRANTAWQETYPITLADYLAVRLTLATRMGEAVAPERTQDLPANGTTRPFLPQIWLQAWEESYRSHLLEALDAPDAEAASEASGQADTAGQTDTTDETDTAEQTDTADETDAVGPAHASDQRPDAQLTFCIDVRSEIIRRHIEAQGHYETHGYAGFFGVPMQHQPYGSEVEVKSCPPIVDPKHRVVDAPEASKEEQQARYDWWTALDTARRTLVKTLKTNVAAAFGFVEGSGGFFGGAMAVRTLLPSALFRLGGAVADWLPGPDTFAAPTVDRPNADASTPPNALPVGLSHEAQVLYAEAAFRLMGWTDRFAPIVVFAGHGTQTPNNPYKSSLDCGACSGNPGGPNARVLASICNDADVQSALRERGIDIPEDTVFLAGQHNTVTDEIDLFVDDETPPVPAEALDRLQQDLRAAQADAAAERVETMNATVDSGQSGAAVREVERRAADWAETRPEWGLAGNASFIIGPRRLTEGVDLNGRAFLHSYDWTADEDGTALENIMTGPLVVGEWINTQYYFSTVDNAAYGSGSKVTHNVVGNLGIYQGNGGDLMTGLPLQSLQIDDEHPVHRPVRLLAVIHAPTERVNQILDRQTSLTDLLDHEWLKLTVMDPTADNDVFHYQPGRTWVPHSDTTSPEPTLANPFS